MATSNILPGNEVKCMICRGTEHGRLAKPGRRGLKRLLKVSKIRNDNVYASLKPDLENIESLGIVCHPKCYSSYTSKTNVYHAVKHDVVTKPVKPATRLSTCHACLFDPKMCFICQKRCCKQGKSKVLRVKALKGEETLRDAAVRRQDEVTLRIAGLDLVANKLKYHASCRSSYVSPKGKKCASEKETEQECEVEGSSAFDRLINQIDEHLMVEGKVFQLSTLRDRLISMMKEDGKPDEEIDNRKVKRFLQKHYGEGVTFQKQPAASASASQIVYSSQIGQLKQLIPSSLPDHELQEQMETTDGMQDTEALAIPLEAENDMEREMKTLMHAALILRSAINSSQRWTFRGSLTDVQADTVPEKLCHFFSWLLKGADADLREITKPAMHLAQSTIAKCLSDYQVTRKTKQQSCMPAREMPQELAVGIAIRQAFRSKKIVQLLHGFGVSVHYERLLRLETQIASGIRKRMSANGGLYIPPDIIPGRHIFFAIDNVDFSEDTTDGKGTLHATAMAIFQRKEAGDEASKMMIDEPAVKRSLRDVSNTLLLDCTKPTTKRSPSHLSFCEIGQSTEVVEDHSESDSAWLVAQTMLARTKSDATEDEDSCDTLTEQSLPTWSAYQSMRSQKMPGTRVGTPPLVAAPAHEWQTLLTVLMQAQGISAVVMGPERKTVVSMDMGLYKPAKELQMSRPDFNHLILRPGELHMILTEQRCMGAYIENSGIDFCWCEANLYGPATVKQIMDGRHMKRGVEAHITTLQALYRLYTDAFLQEHPDVAGPLTKTVVELRNAYVEEDGIQETHAALVDVMRTLEISQKMFKFDAGRESLPLFTFTKNYMQMVMDMLAYIRAVRTGDWRLHLIATEAMVKYFFAHDRQIYARMIPLYLADMKAVEADDPAIHEEFLQGNWVVNKNENVSFCAIGADHALEHVNHSMKVSGGLVGITLNESARTKFFLLAPELARLATEACQMAGTGVSTQMRHHQQRPSLTARHEKNVNALVVTISSFTNPFAHDGKDLINIVTKAVMPEKVKEDVCNRNQLGVTMMNDFVSTRIRLGTTQFWARMKKASLKMWKSSGKCVKIRDGQQMVTLREDRNLFARMLLILRSRPDLDLEEVLGKHELSVVPRALFAADGTMLHCQAKSTLMACLEKLVKTSSSESDDTSSSNLHLGDGFCVALVDGMAEVQALSKPDAITSCALLADHFTNRILEKYGQADEVRVIFDRYDVDRSLKTSTRDRRRGSICVAYHITDSTSIGKVPMKRLLSDGQTKMELTEYLSKKLLHRAQALGKQFVISWGCQCRATHRDVSHLQSNQEEADTKLILHAIDAKAAGASKVSIHSPDTDVFILAIHHYANMCPDTEFVTGTGLKRRAISIKAIYKALGHEKAAALLGLHALSGADNTGSFAGKGKLAFWNAFQCASSNVLRGLSALGAKEDLEEDFIASIERFICMVYVPGTNLNKVEQLRWWLFKKRQAQEEKLPPTSNSLNQAILRAHHQTITWKRSPEAEPEIPSPEGYGWQLQDDKWIPIMTTGLPAPKSLLNLVKCGCSKSRCQTGHCTCRKAGLLCTEMCGCDGDEDQCFNMKAPDTADETDIDDSEEEDEEGDSLE